MIMYVSFVSWRQNWLGPQASPGLSTAMGFFGSSVHSTSVGSLALAGRAIPMIGESPVPSPAGGEPVVGRQSAVAQSNMTTALSPVSERSTVTEPSYEPFGRAFGSRSQRAQSGLTRWLKPAMPASVCSSCR